MVTKSKLDAKAVLEHAQKYVKDGKATVMLPNYLRDIYDQELWLEWTTSTGGKFASFNEAITANQPYGLGVGQYNGWISAAQAWALCAGHGNVRKELLKLAADEVKPIAEHGAIGNGRGSGDNVTSNERGNSAEYLLGRMKREADNGNAKAIAAMEGIKSGRLTSVRQAAIKCGIVKPNGSDKDRCPIDRIKMYWKRASEQERNELLAWLKTAEAKQTKRAVVQRT